MFDPFTDWTQDASYVNAVSSRLRHDHTFLTFQGTLRLAGPPIGPLMPLHKSFGKLIRSVTNQQVGHYQVGEKI